MAFIQQCASQTETIIRPNKRPSDPYIQPLDGGTPILRFFSYGRDFLSDISPQYTELQAFQYVEYMLDQQGLDIRVHIPPSRLSFSHGKASLLINVFEALSYFDLSELLRALGWFHLRYGYFEKKFVLGERGRQKVLCTGQMLFTGAGPATE